MNDLLDLADTLLDLAEDATQGMPSAEDDLVDMLADTFTNEDLETLVRELEEEDASSRESTRP
jgi:hypothetical protein